MTKQQIKKARIIAYRSEQDSIICENRGIIKITTVSKYIEHYLAIYDIKVKITPTGQVISKSL